MRIGLANLPLLLALDVLSPGDFFLLALLKTLGQGIISGTLFSYVFLFSIAGTFSSAALMFVLRKIIGRRYGGFAGVGCAGAMISNGVQLVLARFLVFGVSIRYLAPPFLAAGFVSGVTLGIFCEIFCRKSRWYWRASHAAFGESPAPENKPPDRGSELRAADGAMAGGRERRRLRRRQIWNELFDSRLLFFAGVLLAGIFLFVKSMAALVIMFTLFCVLAWLSGKKINFAITFFVMAGIVFFNLLVPYGKTLAELGPLSITQGALLAGLRKALTLEGLVMLSGACVSSGLRLPGKIGALLAEMFRLLELLRERKRVVRRGHVIEGIDSLMMELGNGE